MARNEGDEFHPSVERIWDIVLTERLARGKSATFGIAVDDAHHYHSEGRRLANPGRGWVMVRAPSLTVEAIIAAMETGDFYATTGVELADIHRDDDAVELAIRPEAGVSYVTQFIGTRRGYQPGGEPLDAPSPVGATSTRRYADDIGVVLAELPGTSPRYAMTGDEIYVRAKVAGAADMSVVIRDRAPKARRACGRKMAEGRFPCAKSAGRCRLSWPSAS